MNPSDVYLFVATPCYGGMVTQRYMQSALVLLQWADRGGVRISIELLGQDSLITRSRNTLAAKFLDTEAATHLMFIDADIGFELRQVIRMLEFDQDVVAGMYPLKAIDWETGGRERASQGEALETAPLRYVGVPCEGAELERDGDFFTARFAGAGFLMIKRPALVTMTQAYPQTRYSLAHTQAAPSRSPNQFALFDPMIEPETAHYLSEDYAFCRRWRDLGGKIWLDTQGELVHIGPHEFPGQPRERFARNAKPQA